MMLEISPKAKRNFFVLLVAGAAAGFLNGLLGAGGGIVLIYTLHALYCDGSAESVRDYFAATIACVIPMTLLSALLYAADGKLMTAGASALSLPAVAGGALGAFFLDKIQTKFLQKLFAALVILAGMMMLRGGEPG